MVAALFCSFFLSAVIARIAERTQMHIWWNYVDEKAYFEAVENLAAACNQLAVMKNGKFLYSGNMRELLEQAKGHVWLCKVKEEGMARDLEKNIMFH